MVENNFSFFFYRELVLDLCEVFFENITQYLDLFHKNCAKAIVLYI